MKLGEGAQGAGRRGSVAPSSLGTGLEGTGATGTRVNPSLSAYPAPLFQILLPRESLWKASRLIRPLLSPSLLPLSKGVSSKEPEYFQGGGVPSSLSAPFPSDTMVLTSLALENPTGPSDRTLTQPLCPHTAPALGEGTVNTRPLGPGPPTPPGMASEAQQRLGERLNSPA